MLHILYLVHISTVQQMNTSSLMESRFIINAMKKPCRHQFVSSFTLLLFLLMMGFMIMISPSALLRLLHARPVESTSVWLFRVSEELEIKPITKGIYNVFSFFLWFYSSDISHDCLLISIKFLHFNFLYDIIQILIMLPFKYLKLLHWISANIFLC